MQPYLHGAIILPQLSSVDECPRFALSVAARGAVTRSPNADSDDRGLARIRGAARAVRFSNQLNAEREARDEERATFT